MRDLNARHPWSHNDHFHSWILAHLPERRGSALDVGCGRGELLAGLSPHFGEVHGIDDDEEMRAAATRRCAGLSNVSVTGDALPELRGGLDLVTMVAVLHHLDVPSALSQVRRLLAPGGRFLAVGLARPRSLRDHAWDMASIVTNPVIGFVKHPWPSLLGAQPPAFPVGEPTLSYDEVRDVVHTVMPGAVIRHQLGFRHTISWTQP
jgi:SAM-dependent methyltransferase